MPDGILSMICNFTDGITYGLTISDMINYTEGITNRIITTTTIQIRNYLAQSSWVGLFLDIIGLGLDT